MPYQYQQNFHKLISGPMSRLAELPTAESIYESLRPKKLKSGQLKVELIALFGKYPQCQRQLMQDLLTYAEKRGHSAVRKSKFNRKLQSILNSFLKHNTVIVGGWSYRVKRGNLGLSNVFKTHTTGNTAAIYGTTFPPSFAVAPQEAVEQEEKEVTESNWHSGLMLDSGIAQTGTVVIADGCGHSDPEGNVRISNVSSFAAYHLFHQLTVDLDPDLIKDLMIRNLPKMEAACNANGWRSQTTLAGARAFVDRKHNTIRVVGMVLGDTSLFLVNPSNGGVINLSPVNSTGGATYQFGQENAPTDIQSQKYFVIDETFEGLNPTEWCLVGLTDGLTDPLGTIEKSPEDPTYINSQEMVSGSMLATEYPLELETTLRAIGWFAKGVLQNMLIEIPRCRKVFELLQVGSPAGFLALASQDPGVSQLVRNFEIEEGLCEALNDPEAGEMALQKIKLSMIKALFTYLKTKPEQLVVATELISRFLVKVKPDHFKNQALGQYVQTYYQDWMDFNKSPEERRQRTDAMVIALYEGDIQKFLVDLLTEVMGTEIAASLVQNITSQIAGQLRNFSRKGDDCLGLIARIV